MVWKRKERIVQVSQAQQQKRGSGERGPGNRIEPECAIAPSLPTSGFVIIQLWIDRRVHKDAHSVQQAILAVRHYCATHKLPETHIDEVQMHPPARKHDPAPERQVVLFLRIDDKEEIQDQVRRWCRRAGFYTAAFHEPCLPKDRPTRMEGV